MRSPHSNSLLAALFLCLAILVLSCLIAASAGTVRVVTVPPDQEIGAAKTEQAGACDDLLAEKAAVLEDLQAGRYCTVCSRTLTEFKKSHQNYEAHFTGAENKKATGPAPQSVIDVKMRHYDNLIARNCGQPDVKAASEVSSTSSKTTVPECKADSASSLNDYPYKGYPVCADSVKTKDCPGSTNDAYGFFIGECTSFVAWRMNRDAGTTDKAHPSFSNTMGGHRWSNGGNWKGNAEQLHYRVDNIPERGAVAQWNAGEKGCGTLKTCGYGHVAYVESVNADGSVNLSEYNFLAKHCYSYRQHVPVSQVGRFIHVTSSSNATPANKPPRPVVTASVRVLTAAPLTVNQRIQITFVISNSGGSPITFQRLLAGGRRDGDPNCAVGGCPDFPPLTNVTLNPGQSRTYTQEQTFPVAGSYHFFAAYLNGAEWVTNVDAAAGVSNSVGVTINPQAAARVSAEELGRMLLGSNYDGITLGYDVYYEDGPTSLTTKGGWHPGIDYRARSPLPIFSPVAGVVDSFDPEGKRIGRVTVRITGTNDYFIFLHLSKVSVKRGQKVNIGDAIGKTGSTGAPPHLHVEVRTGRSGAANYFTSPNGTGVNKDPVSVISR